MVNVKGCTVYTKVVRNDYLSQTLVKCNVLVLAYLLYVMICELWQYRIRMLSLFDQRLQSRPILDMGPNLQVSGVAL